MLIQRDKWIQYRILGSEASLTKHLPATQLLTQNMLKNMLLQYSSIVLKPRNGSYGRDIVFIQRYRSNGYRIQNENSTVLMKNIDQLLQCLSLICKASAKPSGNVLNLISSPKNNSQLSISARSSACSPLTCVFTIALD